MKLQPDKKTHLCIGVIGLPATWEQIYRPALATLARRVRITAIFDAVVARAVAESHRLDATQVNGMLALAGRPDVDGILVLDTGWTKNSLLARLAGIGKPVFLGLEGIGLEAIEYLHSIVTLNGAIWVPDLNHRFAPTTTRLLELVATQIGEPRRVEIVVPESEDAWAKDVLAKTIDWAFFILRGVSTVQSVRIDQSGCRLRCRNVAGQVVDVLIMTARGGEEPHRLVKCSRGEATVTGDQNISWKFTGRAGTEEVLSGESDAVGMQLAVFMRRAAGGLIPTADLSDLHRCHVAAQQISVARF